jgi:hypothetical protein
VAEAERVRDLADDALARADAARAGLEDLLAAVERLRGEISNGGGPATAVAPPPPPPPPPQRPPGPASEIDEARLVALEMAVAGRGRAEVGAHLRAAYEGADIDAILADVFGV